MADSDVVISAGVGTKIDTRTVGAGTDEHRQVIVVGDPTTAANVATVDASGRLAVTVSNTPAVTVSGTPAVTVSGTPAVTISGTPAVTISGTPAVTVSGTPAVTVSGTTLVAGTKSLTTTVAAALASNQACRELLLQNDPTNAVDVLVGDATTQPIRLSPGQAITVPANNANLIYAKNATSTTQTVNWVVMT